MDWNETMFRNPGNSVRELVKSIEGINWLSKIKLRDQMEWIEGLRTRLNTKEQFNDHIKWIKSAMMVLYTELKFRNN